MKKLFSIIICSIALIGLFSTASFAEDKGNAAEVAASAKQYETETAVLE